MKILLFSILSFSFAAQQVFVACEGNFYQSNGSLWSVSQNQVYEYEGNPLGAIVQSLYVNDDKLYVVVNGTGNIQVFDIDDEGLTFSDFIDTDYSGPREIIVVDNNLYFTNWYTADLKRINLETMEIDAEFDMPGLPEKIIIHDGLLYISITMDFDWTDGNQVVVFDPEGDIIVNTYVVGDGPGDMIVHDEEIYIARTYYDDSWNAFYGTSKITESDEIIIANYGSGLACGGSVHSFQGSVYRAFDGGIAKLNESLQILPETRIGNYNPSDIYSVEVINEHVYFGLSDFVYPDQVVVVNGNNEQVALYDVGVAPGDFAIWNACDATGDLNFDDILNVVDVVLVVEHVLYNFNYNCSADLTNDGLVNILDIVEMVQQILN